MMIKLNRQLISRFWKPMLLALIGIVTLSVLLLVQKPNGPQSISQLPSPSTSQPGISSSISPSVTIQPSTTSESTPAPTMPPTSTNSSGIPISNNSDSAITQPKPTQLRSSKSLIISPSIINIKPGENTTFTVSTSDGRAIYQPSVFSGIDQVFISSSVLTGTASSFSYYIASFTGAGPTTVTRNITGVYSSSSEQIDYSGQLTINVIGFDDSFDMSLDGSETSDTTFQISVIVSFGPSFGRYHTVDIEAGSPQATCNSVTVYYDPQLQGPTSYATLNCSYNNPSSTDPINLQVCGYSSSDQVCYSTSSE
jgi:hypothetical protein